MIILRHCAAIFRVHHGRHLGAFGVFVKTQRVVTWMHVTVRRGQAVIRTYIAIKTEFSSACLNQLPAAADRRNFLI